MNRKPSAARVASLMPKSMREAYDIVVRVSALEAIAGLAPRSWPGDRRGLMAAAEHFGGKIHPDWVSTGEQGIARGVESKAHSSFGPLGQLSSEDAEDLTAKVLGGLSVPSNPRGEAGAVANKIQNRVLRGESPKKTFRLMFISHTDQRARDMLKTRNRRDFARGQDVQIGDEIPDGGTVDVGGSDLLSQQGIFLADNPLISRWIQDMLDRWPVRDRPKEIAKFYFANPKHGRVTELARNYGVTKQAIKKTINKAIAYLTQAVQQDRQIQNKLELLHGRMASTLADRWMKLQLLQRVAVDLNGNR